MVIHRQQDVDEKIDATSRDDEYGGRWEDDGDLWGTSDQNIEALSKSVSQ